MKRLLNTKLAEQSLFGHNLVIIFLMLLITGCGPDRIESTTKLIGQTMGTSYSVIVSKLPNGLDQTSLQVKIDSLLKKVNQQMSTYIPDSDLSLLNKQDNDQWLEIPAELVQLIDSAKQISIATEGAYDITVGPLVNLWGFGPNKKAEDFVPDDNSITQTLNKIGYQHVTTRNTPPSLKKSMGDIYIDLSSIAKGYGVDMIGELLEAEGITDYLAEIGGELRTRGASPRNTPWRIGIERPVESEKTIQQALDMENTHMATSGNYRNYFEKEGVRYSHIIDPRTGRPAAHKLASATVLHESTALADAWATALLVLGEEKGFAMAEKHHLAVYFIYKTDDGFATKYTPEFESVLAE